MKKVIGIISVVLLLIIAFQSCTVGVSNAIENSKEASRSAGFILAVCNCRL